MDTRALAKQIITQAKGVAKTADFILGGIPAGEIARLCKEGHLVRICQGFYRAADMEAPSEEQLLAALLPRGIVCVESALFYFGYSEFTPRKWSMAVSRTAARAKLKVEELPLQTYFVQPEVYDMGKSTGIFQGVELPVYDRERTICDCFKYRSRLDHELFNKALNAYAKDTEKNLMNLSVYAKRLRVYKKVNELMEVLLNG